jgi:hypothetical protein
MFFYIIKKERSMSNFKIGDTVKAKFNSNYLDTVSDPNLISTMAKFAETPLIGVVAICDHIRSEPPGVRFELSGRDKLEIRTFPFACLCNVQLVEQVEEECVDTQIVSVPV